MGHGTMKNIHTSNHVHPMNSTITTDMEIEKSQRLKETILMATQREYLSLLKWQPLPPYYNIIQSGIYI